MRVLHLCAGKLDGRVEAFLLTLAQSPATNAAFALCFPGRLRDELVASGKEIVDLPNPWVRGPWSVWAARRALLDHLRKHPPDVVVSHSSWQHALFAPVVRKAGLPLVFWAHDAMIHRSWLDIWASFSPPDLLVANSHFTRESARKVFAPVRSEVVYLPVPPPSFPAGARAALRQEFETPDDTVVIVLACQLDRWKGHGLLLEALLLLRDLPDWACWIAGGAQRPGEARYFSELSARVRRSGLVGRVEFVGQRADVPALLSAGDIHCQPDTGGEPFGLTFLEALHAGLPVVTTRLGEAEEILDASCGVLVPPQPEALAEALAALIRNPSRRAMLGKAGPARALALCEPARQIAKINELLADVARSFKKGAHA